MFVIYLSLQQKFYKRARPSKKINISYSDIGHLKISLMQVLNTFIALEFPYRTILRLYGTMTLFFASQRKENLVEIKLNSFDELEM